MSKRSHPNYTANFINGRLEHGWTIEKLLEEVQSKILITEYDLRHSKNLYDNRQNFLEMSPVPGNRRRSVKQTKGRQYQNTVELGLIRLKTIEEELLKILHKKN